METQRLEAGREVESTGSTVQEVGSGCYRGGAWKVRELIQFLP